MRHSTVRERLRQSARVSTANNAKNANGPVTVQAANEAPDFRARVTGPDAGSVWSVNRELRTALTLTRRRPTNLIRSGPAALGNIRTGLLPGIDMRIFIRIISA